VRGGFLQESLLASVPMSSGSPTSADAPVLGSGLSEAIGQRYEESGAESYGIPLGEFRHIVAAVVVRYAADASEAEQMQLVVSLHVPELALARACSAGNDAAWETFLARFRSSMYAAANRITRNDATGRELADGLYAELYGLPDRNGRRVSKLDYYMGRGSLEGWLRTVLSQQYIDRYRSQSREVSLEQQIEVGVSFADRTPAPTAQPDRRMAAAVSQELAALGDEERFLLASYYLDERTLANIGRQLRVHESTISRRLERLTGELRKRVRKRLEAAGVDRRRCEELLQEFDVRDLNVDVAANLRQETSPGTFHE
jgi:RNA polymerase sigma-70 factor (ECF subfamily)